MDSKPWVVAHSQTFSHGPDVRRWAKACFYSTLYFVVGLVQLTSKNWYVCTLINLRQVVMIALTNEKSAL